jgi:nicotinate-nucleotide pyrophosphorylase (carboxylating)
VLSFTELIHAISVECNVDRVNDDVTVNLLGEAQNIPARAILRAKDFGVFSGDSVVEAFKQLFETQILLNSKIQEGESLTPGQEILRMEGTAGRCLSLERTLINYLSHLSGVATLTRRFVDAVQPNPVEILATRKTLPGLRDLQLQAVVAGGGKIHRRNLSDGILIKENHQIFCEAKTSLALSGKNRSPLHRVEIEVQDFFLLERVLECPPDIIMLDNFSESELPQAIKKIRTASKAHPVKIEVSGGMTIDKVARIASMGVDYISVGQLTHSSPSLNMSMDLERL